MASKQSSSFSLIEQTLFPTSGNDRSAEASLELLRKGWYSDCVVKCQNFEWKAHKAILCPRNSCFHAALSGSFREGSTNIVVLDDDEPFAVECLLHYLYSYRYPTFKSTNLTQCPSNPWEFDVALFKLADKRDFGCLRSHTVKIMIEKLANCFHAYNDLDPLIASLPFLWEVPSQDGHNIRKAALKLLMEKEKDLFSMTKVKKLLHDEPKIAFNFYAALADTIKEQDKVVKKQSSDILNLNHKIAKLELGDKQSRKSGGTPTQATPESKQGASPFSFAPGNLFAKNPTTVSGVGQNRPS